MKFDKLFEYILINHNSDDDHDDDDQGDGDNFFRLRQPIMQVLKDNNLEYLVNKTGQKFNMFISYLDDMGAQYVEVVDIEYRNHTQAEQEDDEELVEGDWNHYAIHITTKFAGIDHDICLNFIEDNVTEEYKLEIE